MHRKRPAVAPLLFVSWVAVVLGPELATAQDALSSAAAITPPPPDVVPWFVARRFELAAVSVLALGTFIVDVWRNGLGRSFGEQLGHVRMAVLVGLFGVTALWGAETQRRRTERHEWQRPLHVAVTLVDTEPLDAQVVQAFTSTASRAMAYMRSERQRYGTRAAMPFWIHTFGPVRVKHEPPRPLDTHNFFERAWFRFELGRYFAQVNRQANMTANRYDVRLYVLARRPSSSRGPRFVEGIGEAEGELGLVDVDLDQAMVEPAWIAVLHELLHTVGATDKYDADGHPALPEGLAEPGLVPLFPQRQAEIMVGEIPLAPRVGRIPNGFGEVRVGAVTAREIGWH